MDTGLAAIFLSSSFGPIMAAYGYKREIGLSLIAYSHAGAIAAGCIKQQNPGKKPGFSSTLPCGL